MAFDAKRSAPHDSSPMDPSWVQLQMPRPPSPSVHGSPASSQDPANPLFACCASAISVSTTPCATDVPTSFATWRATCPATLSAVAAATPAAIEAATERVSSDAGGARVSASGSTGPEACCWSVEMVSGHSFWSLWTTRAASGVSRKSVH